MTDTYNSMSGNSAEAVENARREEAEIWRKRYMNTFMSGTPVNNPDSVNRNDEPEEEKPKTFDDLFN